jgi:putative salt-induced outer membrane protein
MRTPAALRVLLAVALASRAVHADEPPPPDPGDPTWASRGQVGFAKTSGNTDTSTGNFLIHAAHVVEDWKFLMGAEEAWDGYGQANYNLTERLYGYTSARYDDDRFSGFAYQTSLAGGTGYQFIKTDDTKLSAQIGVGVRRLRPEILVKDANGGIISSTELEATTEGVLDAGLTFEHAFNPDTKILAGATLEAGKDNTLTTANLSLQVKMTSVLALAAGIQMSRNSNPPMGSVNTDTLTTLNLVYELKNPKLEPQ